MASESKRNSAPFTVGPAKLLNVNLEEETRGGVTYKPGFVLLLPQVNDPKEKDENGKLKLSASGAHRVRAEIAALAREAYPNWSKDRILEEVKNRVKDGDLPDDNGNVKPHEAGHWRLNVTVQPHETQDPNRWGCKKEGTGEDKLIPPAKLYPGNWVMVDLHLYKFEAAGKKGITYGFNGMARIDLGERIVFGGQSENTTASLMAAEVDEDLLEGLGIDTSDTPSPFDDEDGSPDTDDLLGDI